jgi:hypothetical protein
MTHDYHENHRILEKLVEREVGYCMSYLISDLAKIVHNLDYATRRELSFDAEDIDELMYQRASNEEAAFEEGWRVTEYNGDWYYHKYDIEPFTKNFPKGYGVEWREVDPEDDSTEAGFYPSGSEKCYENEEDAIEDEWLYYLDSDAGPHNYESDAWDACVENENIGTSEHDSDIYEHWIVSSFFGRQLEKFGHTVKEINA